MGRCLRSTTITPALCLLPLIITNLLLCGSLLLPIENEMKVLLTIRASLADPLGRLDNWIVVTGDHAPSVNYSTSPCTWNGVQCSHAASWDEAAGPIVTSLDLSHMNLSGTLSGAIGLLRNLVNLSIAVNNFTGRLPMELCDIGASLRSINISNNLFQGSFPSQNLSKLPALEVLDAYNNNFTGPLPLQISSLTRMRHLHLGGNYFEGSIPPQYGALQNLTYLALSGNSLTGRIPVELGNLANLQQLYLGYYNVFDGGIPSALGRLSELVVLDMADCGLTGSIPFHLQNLTKLVSLFVQINTLTGSIPPGLGQLVNLQSLDLSNNLLSGHIPQLFSNLVNLKLLNLFRNQLHGSIPSFIGDLPSLQVLCLWENNLTGTVPAQLGSNGNLMVVDLSSNSLTGHIPPTLCSGGKLERLILFYNMFTGPIPESLGSCATLVRIRLGQNQLSGVISSRLLALPSLQMLEAPRNQLNGSIPNIATASDMLGLLDFSGNRLADSIPSSISKLASLQTLLLPGNVLSGAIPLEMSSLKHLSKLDLSGNRLTGSVPPSLGQCMALTYIDVSRNKLAGGIPQELQNLGVLDYLNLSRNYLSGAIPPAFELMNTLTAVDFSYNNLSGVIPDQGEFVNFNASSFIGNPGLCGAQLVPCSPRADSSTSHLFHGVRTGPALVYWLIVGVISLLTLVLFVVGVFFNRHAFCALIGRHTMEIPWKLTAYQKLDFAAAHVLSCLTDENIIGKGGSGTVYKCATPSGYVAVKRLPGTYRTAAFAKVAAGSSHDHGYSAEIQTLGMIRHRNIVKLLGCCSSRDTNLLVYEYMPNGSLGELLHGTRGGSLDWAKRYTIAVEAACGLRYLHHDCSPLIVHRDVKSNNILLDAKYKAYVADFGLAKVLDYPESMSSVAGSYGYIAPEYVYTLKVDEKSDIYSFGVVLLELVTGRRPFEPEYGEGVDIATWVRKKVQTREGVIAVIDNRIRDDVSCSMDEVMRVLRVALHCLVELPMQRPTMKEVVQMLTEVSARKSIPTTNVDKQQQLPTLLDLHNPSSSSSSPLLSAVLQPPSPSRPPNLSGGKVVLEVDALGSSSPPDLITI